MADVLIVEDDEDIRFVTMDFLASEGIRSVGCTNGREALEYLDAHRDGLPKLLLVDLMMPIMDGFAFRKAQAADPQLAKIPFVVMSADSHANEKCEAMGVKDCFRKPVDLNRLIALVQQYVQ